MQDIIGWDTETHLIEDGNLTPKLVCASFCRRTRYTFDAAQVLGYSLMQMEHASALLTRDSSGLDITGERLEHVARCCSATSFKRGTPQW